MKKHLHKIKSLFSVLTDAIILYAVFLVLFAAALWAILRAYEYLLNTLGLAQTAIVIIVLGVAAIDIARRIKKNQ